MKYVKPVEDTYSEESSVEGDDLLQTVEGEEIVDLGTSVVVPKGANTEGRPREAVKDCVDRYPSDCAGFVRQGECERNPGWMIINCAKRCYSIHSLYQDTYLRKALITR